MRRAFKLLDRCSGPKSLFRIPFCRIAVEHKPEPVLPKIPRGAERHDLEGPPTRKSTAESSKRTTKTTTTTYVASASNICDDEGCPVETEAHLPASDATRSSPFHSNGTCPVDGEEVVTRVIEITIEEDAITTVNKYAESESRLFIREGSLEEELRQQELMDEVEAQVAGEEAEEFDALGNLHEAREDIPGDEKRKKISKHEPDHQMWERANQPPNPPRRSFSSATAAEVFYADECGRINVEASQPITGGYSEQANTGYNTAPVPPEVSEHEQHIAPLAAEEGGSGTELEQELAAEVHVQFAQPEPAEAEGCKEHSVEEESEYGTMLHPGSQTGA